MPLAPQFPSQGWKQLLAERKRMLDLYDQAKQQANIHKIQTYHGRAGEAIFRACLESFLPGKYGVTSGYVISPGRTEQQKAAF